VASGSFPGPRGAGQDPDDRLESWKAISSYLKRDIRTLHRWEHDEGLPVHRHHHQKRGTVYAYRAELDRWRDGRRTKRVHQRAGNTRRLMLAVLPFENVNGLPDDDYFSDGLTEDVITQLGRLHGDRLGVIARTSVMRYKQSQKPIVEIARDLRVDCVLEGRVRRVGDRVRLTVQLIQVADQTQLWADQFDRELDNILALQAELAAALTERLGIGLAHSGSRPVPHVVDPEAFEAYLKGRFHWYKLSPLHLDTALQYFQRALEKDPGYALAYEGMAAVWLMRGDTGLLPAGEALMKAKTAALHAVQIDDTLAEVHVTLANLKFCHEWDWPGAAAEFERAIHLNPNSADAHLFYGDFLMSLGRTTDAAKEMTRALELDPFNFFFQCFFGWHLVYLREYRRAIAQLNKTLGFEPRFASAHLGQWGAFAGLGLYDEALGSARRFFEALDDREACDALGASTGERGYRTAMRRAADTLAARATGTHVSAVRVARLYAQARDRKSALEWLERAFQRRESPLVHLDVAWDWLELRRETRFRDLLNRIGFRDRRRVPEREPAGHKPSVRRRL